MSTAALYSLGQWLRRIGGDHDEMIASQRQVDRNDPVPLTQAEIVEGMNL